MHVTTTRVEAGGGVRSLRVWPASSPHHGCELLGVGELLATLMFNNMRHPALENPCSHANPRCCWRASMGVEG